LKDNKEERTNKFNPSLDIRQNDISIDNYVHYYEKGGLSLVLNSLISLRNNSLFINEPTLQSICNQFFNRFSPSLGNKPCQLTIMKALFKTFNHIYEHNHSFSHDEIVQLFIANINRFLERKLQ
jgi:hypothetical protein